MASGRSIVGIAVSILLVAILVPIAMTEIVGANTTGFSSAVLTLFGTIVPILAIIGIALKYVPGSKGSSRSVVNVAIGLPIFAIMMPIGILILVNVNTSTWPTATGVVFATVLPILALVGIALKFLKK